MMKESPKKADMNLSRRETVILRNISPSKMTEEEKMHYKNRLFREADELSEKISF